MMYTQTGSMKGGSMAEPTLRKQFAFTPALAGAIANLAKKAGLSEVEWVRRTLIAAIGAANEQKTTDDKHA